MMTLSDHLLFTETVKPSSICVFARYCCMKLIMQFKRPTAIRLQRVCSLKLLMLITTKLRA